MELFVIFINGLLAGYESIFIELFEKNREFSTKISYQIALQRKKQKKRFLYSTQTFSEANVAHTHKMSASLH